MNGCSSTLSRDLSFCLVFHVMLAVVSKSESENDLLMSVMDIIPAILHLSVSLQLSQT